MQKFLNRKFPNENYPPILFHILYLMAAFTFCFIYHHKVVSSSDFYNDEYGAILKLLNMESIRSIQYRIFVPIIFKILSLLNLLPSKAIFFIIMFGFTYLTIVVFYRVLGKYFTNKGFNAVTATFILYPMIWNFVAINSIFFFVDTAVIFFMTLCLYLVITKKNNWLLIAFFLGASNHYSIGFIIPVFLLFNYNRLFKKDTIAYTLAMILLLVSYFTVLRVVFPNLPEIRDDGFVAWRFGDAWQTLVNYKKHLLIRDLIINMGGLHLFAMLFFFSGMWKKFKTEYIAVFLIIFPFALFALFRLGIRIEEMRNFIPLIPFVIVPAMLYFSQYSSELLKLSPEILKNNK